MKVWIMKYALTQGIFEVDADDDVDDGIISYQPPGCLTVWLNKKYWRETKAEAIAIANEMRIRKIANLRKQIEKLEKLEY